MDIITELFCSKTQTKIIQILWRRSVPTHLRYIYERSNTGMSTVQKVLKSLHKKRLIKKKRENNRLYYWLNENHPYYPLIETICKASQEFEIKSRAKATEKEGVHMLRALSDLNKIVSDARSLNADS